MVIDPSVFRPCAYLLISSFTGAVVHGDGILGRNRTVIPVYRSHIQLHWINYEIMNSREIFRSSAQWAHGKEGTL